jgi:asparagine synthase (glutamine-hydrolysing)
VSTYFLAEAMARHVKVAVSGDGADELFGSYLSHRIAFQKAAEGAEPDWEWRAKLLVLSEEEKRQLYAPAVRDALADTSTAMHLHRAFEHLTAQDPLNRILEAEFGGIFPDQVLTFVDRLSMAHALEVRSPVSRHRRGGVRRLVARPPQDLQRRDQASAEEGSIAVFPRGDDPTPQGGIPDADHVMGARPSQPWVRETLSPERLRVHGLFDPAYVGRLIDGLREPGADYVAVNRVLVLAIFQEWYELYLAS